MELGLNKLPWKRQVGVFIALAIAALGGFYWYYVQDIQAAQAVEQTKLDKLRADIAKGSATARQLPQFRQEVATLEARLESLRAVLPEEKDVGDLLRRIQTLATQSNLQIKGFKPASGGRWTGGSIYDPQSGKTYDSKLSLNPDGTLKVEGCISIICQAQTWKPAS